MTNGYQCQPAELIFLLFIGKVPKAAAGTVCTGTQSSEPSSGKQDQPAAGGRGWAGFLDKKSRTDA